MAKRIRQASQTQPNKNIPKARRIRLPKQERKRTHSIKLPEPERTNVGNEKAASVRRRERAEDEMYRAAISEGMDRSQLRNLFGGSDSKVAAVARRVMAEDGQKFLSQSTAHRYYEYMLRQEQSIRDLDFLLNLYHEDVILFQDAIKHYDPEGVKLPARPSMQAAIMAIKAKSDINDRVLKMGQDMGIIEKRAKELRVSGQLNLAAASTERLKGLLELKIQQYSKLVSTGALPPVYKKMLKRANDDEESLRSRPDDSEHIMDAEYVESST